MAVTTATAIVAGAVIGAGTSMYIASEQADAQQDMYNAQYQAEQQAAISNAQAQMTAAEASANALIHGARTEAHATMQAAGAQAAGVREAAMAQAEAADTAAEEALTHAFGNIELMKEEAAENLRRLEAEQTQLEARTRAAAGASGGENTGSTALYIDALSEENTRQFGWLSGAFASQQEVAESGAQGTYRASQAYADALRTSGLAEATSIGEAARITADALIEGAAIRAGATRSVAAANYNAVFNTYNNPYGGGGGNYGYTSPGVVNAPTYQQGSTGNNPYTSGGGRVYQNAPVGGS